MSEKISEYITSVTALASGDLMDVSKLISTSPLEYQSQKLNYSVLLTELNADLGFIDGSGTTNTVPKFTVSGTIGDSTIIDNGVNYLLSLLSTNGFVKTSGGTGQLSVSSQVSATEGGTGRGSWTAGSLPYISATNTFNELAAGTNGYYLSMVAGVPAWAAVSAPNLGSANLTSADNARTFTLKSGGTASQNLQFLNSGGGNLLTLYGNRNIEFGSSSSLLPEFLINLSGTGSNFRIAVGATAYALYYDAPAFNLRIASNTSNKVELYGHLGQITTFGSSSSGFFLSKTSGLSQGALYVNNGSNLYLNNDAGTRLVNIESVNGFGHIVGGWAVGLAYSTAPTARLHTKGSGSTSATKTALFENSASVSALTIKDDLYCIFRAKDAVIPDGDLANNEMSFYIEEATNDLHFKVKFSTGTVKSGKINLT